MKKLLKRKLKRIGLLSEAQNIYFHLSFWKYRNRRVWYFNRRHIDLKFSATDEYSRKWFYPRYGKGKIHELWQQGFLWIIFQMI